MIIIALVFSLINSFNTQGLDCYQQQLCYKYTDYFVSMQIYLKIIIHWVKPFRKMIVLTCFLVKRAII